MLTASLLLYGGGSLWYTYCRRLRSAVGFPVENLNQEPVLQIRNPGWKYSNKKSGINIPDPQQCREQLCGRQSYAFFLNCYSAPLYEYFPLYEPYSAARSYLHLIKK